jgi:energy-coupling factor transporter transmembrane protein EcfT
MSMAPFDRSVATDRQASVLADPALGVPGRLACLAAVLLAAVAGDGWRAAFALALALGLSAAFHPRALGPMRAYAALMVVLLLVPAALMGGPPFRAAGPVRLSVPGLRLGAEMAARALSILVAAAGFAATVPVVAVASLLDRVGLRGLGFALGVAVNMLPVLQASAATTWQAFRQRGGLRRRPLRSVRLLLATVVSETLRRADEVVAAAHARGFGTARRPPAIVRGRFDLALAAALTAVVALMWLLPYFTR